MEPKKKRARRGLSPVAKALIGFGAVTFLVGVGTLAVGAYSVNRISALEEQRVKVNTSVKGLLDLLELERRPAVTSADLEQAMQSMQEIRESLQNGN